MLLDSIPVRLRLAFGHLVWMALFLMGAALVLYKTVEIRLYDSIDTTLISSAQAIKNTHHTSTSETDELDKLVDHFFKDSWQLKDKGSDRPIRPFGHIINVTAGLSHETKNIEVSLPVTHNTIRSATKGKVSFETFHFKDRAPLRQVSVPVMQDGKFTGDLIQVGASLGDTEETLAEVAFILWIFLPLTLFVSGGLGYALTTRSFQPVTQISNAVSKMSIDDLSIRLPYPFAKDELYMLCQTFNHMLDRLEESVKRLQRFTGDVAHELRTPIAVIRAEAELTLRKERPIEQYVESISQIQKETVHMTEIVEQLLLLAKAQGNSISIVWENLNSYSFLEKIKSSVQKIAQLNEVSLDFQSNIEKFSCSEVYLSLALKNIVLNAIKHSPLHEKIIVKIDKENNYIKISVQDFGTGIPEESLPFIFDTFYRVDSARNRALGGVGIGLSLAKALVELHKGKIYAESKLDKGSLFIIKIPYRT